MEPWSIFQVPAEGLELVILDILLRQSRLAQFYQDLLAKALLLVNATVVEIFYQDLLAKALLLVNPTVGEIFYQDLLAKALLMVNPTVG